MTWYALQAPRDMDVAEDLSAAGIVVARPVYRLRYWHPRKSVVVSKLLPLLPGYLLVRTPALPDRCTRHWCRLLVDHASGEPLRVPEADDLIAAAESGAYDEHLGRGQDTLVSGSRVLVRLLGLAGAVVRRRGRQYEVMLDTGITVLAGRSGLGVA